MIHCVVVKIVWKNIQQWLPIVVSEEDDCCSHFLNTVNILKRFGITKKVGDICLVICWCVWQRRNDIIFNGDICDVGEPVFNVKMFTWRWLALDLKEKLFCNFYEWCQNLIDCLIGM